VGLFAAVVFAVMISRESLRMIVLAALIAFVVRPVIDSLSRRLKNRRGAAIAIVYILVVLLIILIPFLVIPALVQALNSISVALHEYAAAGLADSINVLVQNLTADPVLGGGLIPPLESLSDLLTQIAAEGPPPLEVTADEVVLTGAMGITLEGLAGILGPLIASIVSLVFALLISIQMTIAGDMFRNGALSMVPAAYKPEITALMNKLGHIWNSFLRGELLLMLVVGLCVWFGNWLIGTPQALALGIIAGLLEVIPSLGPLLAWIPAVILALVFGSTRFTGMDPVVFALLVSAMYGLIQALENQVLVPQILGDAVNLPPVVVLIGVTIFGSLFGILGILIATPTIATLAEIFDYLYDKILEGPAPPPDEDKRSLLDNVRGFIGRIRPPWRRERKQEPARVEAPVTPAE
jgi:predicted PurR-regulated permease PerM